MNGITPTRSASRVALAITCLPTRGRLLEAPIRLPLVGRQATRSEPVGVKGFPVWRQEEMPGRIERNTIKRARRFRKDMTNGEARFWKELRLLKAHGLHVRRQVPIGPYVADFAIMKSRLVIEIDGSLHQAGHQIEHDRKRDAWMNSQGFRVLRFSTGAVSESMDGCIEEIMREAGVL